MKAVVALLVVLCALGSAERLPAGLGGAAGKLLAAAKDAAGALGEGGLAGKSPAEVMEYLQTLTADVVEQLENKEKHSAVFGLISRTPEFVPGSSEDGTLSPPVGTITTISMTSHWDPNADHKQLISFANKHSLFPPCAVVVVAKNHTPFKSESTQAQAVSKTSASSSAKPRFRALSAPAGKGAPKASAKSSGKSSAGKSAAKKFTTSKSTQVLKGLLIPNVFVVSLKDFSVLASGDLSLPFGKKKGSSSAKSSGKHAPKHTPKGAPKSSPKSRPATKPRGRGGRKFF